MNRSVVAIALWGYALLSTSRAEPEALDPFAPVDPFAAPAEERAAAGTEAPKEPARFVLETHTVRATGDDAPQTVTLKLNTATGEVRRFDGKAFALVSVEGLRGWQQEVVKETPEQAEDVQRRDAVIAKMKQIILPEVHFRQASVDDVMEFLADASREHDPDKKGVAFATVAAAREDVALDPLAPLDPFAPSQSRPGGPLTVTFRAKSLSLYEVCSTFGTLTDLKWRIRNGVIVWSQVGNVSETVATKVFRLSPPAVQWIARFLAEQEDAKPEAADPVAMSPKTAPRVTSKDDSEMVRFLREFGVTGLWDPRFSVTFRPDVGLLTVTTVPEGLAVCEALVAVLNISSPGCFRLLPVARPDDRPSLLLLDSESGNVWEYQLAPGESVDGFGRFVRVDEPPNVEPLE